MKKGSIGNGLDFEVTISAEKMVEIEHVNTKKRVSFWTEYIVGKENTHILLVPVNSDRTPVIVDLDNDRKTINNLKKCFGV